MPAKAKPERALSGLAEFFRDRYLSVDPRWLGIFRIVFGVLLFCDGSRRWAAARAFYSNDGLLPNHFSLFRPMGRNVFSLFHAFSTIEEVSVAFVLTLISFSLFTVGYKTKLFHALSALCITSLNARNIFVENGGTVVVNILAIWTLFLPLGRRFSVDSLLRSLRARREQTPDELNDRSDPPRDDSRFVSIIVLGLMLQWSVIYFFNYVHKTGEGWKNGSTLHWFWHQDRIVTWFGIWARDHVPISVVKLLTWSTLCTEATLSCILLIPFFQTWTRRAALLLAFGLHGGIALSSRLGPFSYVMTTFFLLLLGERDWQLLSRWFGRPSRARRVIYDADCGICLFTCRVLKRLDVFERLTFIGSFERDKIPESLSAEQLQKSAAVIDPKGRVTFEERAVFEILRALPFGILLGFWLRVPGLAWLGRRLYRAFAENRLRISAFFGLGVCGVRAASPAALPGESVTSEAPTPTVAREADSDARVEPPPAPEVEPAPDTPSETAEANSETAEANSETAEANSETAEANSESAPAKEAQSSASTPPTSLREELRSFGVFLREAMAVMFMLAIASQVAVENQWMRERVRVRQPKWMSTLVEYPRIFQGWGMFAPEPPYDDGRIIVDGRTADGRRLDPLTGKEPDFDPYTPTGWGHNQFWCDYHNRIRFPGHAGNRQHLREYLLNVHRFGGKPEDRLVAFDVWWVSDNSPPPGQKRGIPRPPEKLLSHGFVRDSGATPWIARASR